MKVGDVMDEAGKEAADVAHDYRAGVYRVLCDWHAVDGWAPGVPFEEDKVTQWAAGGFLVTDDQAAHFRLFYSFEQAKDFAWVMNRARQERKLLDLAQANAFVDALLGPLDADVPADDPVVTKGVGSDPSAGPAGYTDA